MPGATTDTGTDTDTGTRSTFTALGAITDTTKDTDTDTDTPPPRLLLLLPPSTFPAASPVPLLLGSTPVVSCKRATSLLSLGLRAGEFVDFYRRRGSSLTSTLSGLARQLQLASRTWA